MLLNQEKPSVVNLSQPNKIMNTKCVIGFYYVHAKEFSEYLVGGRGFY
jgi:hypothetical protein